MRKGLHRALIAVAVAAVLLAAASAYSAQGGKALLYPKGQVFVDGKAVHAVTTVFAGDRIVTALGATASLISKGTAAVIPSNSDFVFGNGVPLQLSKDSAAQFLSSSGPTKCPPGHGGNGHDCRPISPSQP